MKHVLFKVKKDKQHDWRSWCVFLSEHQREAQQTMQEENCVYERSVMYERDGEYYVVGSSEFNGDPKKADLSVELNVKHQEAKGDCLGKAVAIFEGVYILPPVYETLYEFDLR